MQGADTAFTPKCEDTSWKSHKPLVLSFVWCAMKGGMLCKLAASLFNELFWRGGEHLYSLPLPVGIELALATGSFRHAVQQCFINAYSFMPISKKKKKKKKNQCLFKCFPC